MNDQVVDRAAALVDPQGRPVARRKAEDRTCPQCGSGPEARVASGGFGARHPVCGQCGHAWMDEVWHD